MWDSRCIVVEPDCELRIGADASSDVIVTLPKLRVMGSHIVASRYHDMARVSCNEEGELKLKISHKYISLYISGVQIKAGGEVLTISPGTPISFGGLHRRATFRFFTSDMVQKTRITPQRRTAHIPVELNLEALTEKMESESKMLPPSLKREVMEQLKSPRSPRVVHIITPTEIKREVNNEKEEQSVILCNSTPAHGSIRKNSCNKTDNFSFTQNMYSNSTKPLHEEEKEEYYDNDEEDNFPHSPPVITPYVVEMWGQRATLHSVVGPSASDISQSSEIANGTIYAHETSVDPYITFNGHTMLKGFRHLRFETPVRSVAANVIEYLEDAYDVQEQTFLQFSEQTKEVLFQHFLVLAEHAVMAMLATPLTVRLNSPIVCCGDIHGSFADLKIIFDSVVPFHHWSLMTMPVLFLGDYVDRGLYDVEVMLFLLAWHALCPENIILLRGNHEDEGVNGDIEIYGDLSFRKKCFKFFGDKSGEIFWKRVNDVFSNLPVVAIIDDTILACHGGIPLVSDKRIQTKEIKKEEKEEKNEQLNKGKDYYNYDKDLGITDIEINSQFDNEIPSEDFLQILFNGSLSETDDIRFRRLMPINDDDIITAQNRRLIREFLWNDPVSSVSIKNVDHNDDDNDNNSNNNNNNNNNNESSEQDSSLSLVSFDIYGFRSNLGRGEYGNIIREFSISALNAFMRRWGFTLLIRAHQQKMSGLEMGLAGRVLTLFSSANYAGDGNRAGACIIAGGEVRPVSWRRPDLTNNNNNNNNNNSGEGEGEGERRRLLGGTPGRYIPRLSSKGIDSAWSSFDRTLEQNLPPYVGMAKRKFG